MEAQVTTTLAVPKSDTGRPVFVEGTEITEAALSTISRSVTNSVKIAMLETVATDTSKRLDGIERIMTELHADMTGRKAVFSVGGKLLQYVGWGIAGLGAAFGVSHSNAALSWLSSFPTGSH